nr:hypothetical protein [Tanacetum cinerariifolium]
GRRGGEFDTVMQHWKAEEEKFLCKTWIEVSKSNAIGADRNLDTFWWQVTHACNKATCIVNRMKDMIMGKWATVNGTCQKFNVVFKSYERNGKSGESPTDLIELAKLQFRKESNTGKNYLEHAWRVLKEYLKWATPDPANPVDLTELFGDDVRPRPAGKPRLAKMGRRAQQEAGSQILYPKLCIPNSSSSGKPWKKHTRRENKKTWQ